MNYNNSNKSNIIDSIRRNVFSIAIVFLTVTLLIVFGIDQRNKVDKKKGDVVNEFYSSTLKPLFTSEVIEKKDVLNFALEGDLVLDKSKNKVLQLSKNSDGREVLGIKRFDKNEDPDSYTMVVEMLKLEDGKRKDELDSILLLYSEELSKSIYKDKNSVLAVDPEIGIIRKLLNRDLSNFVKDKSSIDNSLNLITKNRENKTVRDYLVFTSDTVYRRGYQHIVSTNPNTEPEELSSIVENKGETEFPSMDEGKDFDIQIDSNFMSVTFNDFLEMDEFENIHLFKTFIDSTNKNINFSFEILEDTLDNVKLKLSYVDSANNKIRYEMSSDKIGEAIENSIKIFSGKDVEDWIEFGNKMDSISHKRNNNRESKKKWIPI